MFGRRKETGQGGKGQGSSPGGEQGGPAPGPSVQGVATVRKDAGDAGRSKLRGGGAEAGQSKKGPKDEAYYKTKTSIFGALIDTIDLAQLAKLDPASARDEMRDIVNEIIAARNMNMSIAEQEHLLEDVCNDILGYGPLQPLLLRDDIADIMINGAATSFIEVNGKVEDAGVFFPRQFSIDERLSAHCQSGRPPGR